MIVQPGAVTLQDVSLSDLKRFALQSIPSGPLRDDILSQPDKLAAEEFLASARVWLRMARAS